MTVQPFAVAIDGVSPEIPQLPVTVIVLLVTLGNAVYTSSSSAGPKLQSCKLTVIGHPKFSIRLRALHALNGDVADVSDPKLPELNRTHVRELQMENIVFMFVTDANAPFGK